MGGSKLRERVGAARSTEDMLVPSVSRSSSDGDEPAIGMRLWSRASD